MEKNNLINNYIYYPYTDLNNFVYKLDHINDLRARLSLIIFTNITDLFFLRRFLDKDYITKAITYTGAVHSINYINFLV